MNLGFHLVEPLLPYKVWRINDVLWYLCFLAWSDPNHSHHIHGCIEGRFSFASGVEVPLLSWSDRSCEEKNWFVCLASENNTIPAEPPWSDKIYLGPDHPSFHLKSPLYPHLYPNMQSIWTSIISPAGSFLIIEFDFFDVEEEKNCSYDRLIITEMVYHNFLLSKLPSIILFQDSSNSSSVPHVLCGNKSQNLKSIHYASTHPILLVQFETDFSNQRKGFSANVRHTLFQFYFTNTTFNRFTTKRERRKFRVKLQ